MVGKVREGATALKLETKRLVIRTYEPSDGELWLAMVNQREFRRFLPPFPHQTIEAFARMVGHLPELEAERGYGVWAVVASDHLVGQCGLAPVEGTGPGVELVYHFATEAWGKGFATEAARAVLSYAFGTIGLERVVALVMPENVASCRVAEKAGMRFEQEVSAYDIETFSQYAAERGWWAPPGEG